MSAPNPCVTDTKPLVASLVAGMRLLGSVVPPAAEKMLELAFAWLLNDAQAHAFRFAASAIELRCAGAAGADRVAAVFRDIASDTAAVAGKARAELEATGKRP